MTHPPNMSSTHLQQPLLARIKREENVSVAFKVGGVGALAAMDKVQSHDDGTDGSGSNASDLTALENETDDFGRRLIQHQRDIERLKNALRPGQQPFRKARPQARLVDRLDGRAAARVAERTGSGGSADSEPPLNLPRTWGSKAQPRSEWLKRQRAGAGEAAVVKAEPLAVKDEDAIIPHRTAYTGDEDWVAVNEDALETTPPSMRRHGRRVVSTPSSMGHMNDTVAGEGGEEDFTSASLLASTPAPPVNRRDRRIDDLTRRELDSLSKRGVTTRNLEQILESSSPGRSTTHARPGTAPAISNPASHPPRRRRSLIGNKENQPPNGESSYFKGTETVSLSQRSAEAVTFKNHQRPSNHRRSDSYHLLKRLARVSSMSPSPGSPGHDVEVGRSKSVPEVDVDLFSAKTTNSEYVAVSSRSRTKGGEDERREEMVEQEAGVEDLETPNVDVTPAPTDPPGDGKTPVVTGAWVDTPGQKLDLRPLLQSTDSAIVRAFGTPSAKASLEADADTIPQRAFSEPVNAKSALADVLKEVQQHPDHQLSESQGNLGDATIQSLEDIVNPDLEPTLTADLPEAVAEAASEEKDPGRELTQAEKDQRQEDLALEAMNKHLRLARTTLKDANRSLRRVEHRIEDIPATTASSSTVKTTPPIHGVCPTCGHDPTTSTLRTLFHELRSLLYTTHPYFTFTPLGLTLLFLLAYMIAENVLCEIYCHPLYAHSMKGFGVDPNAPRFPFVIPTLVLRPFRGLWEPMVEAVEWWWIFEWKGLKPMGMQKAAAAGVGMTSGLFERGWKGVAAARSSGRSSNVGGWMRTATANAMAATGRVVSSTVQAADEVGRMWEDEVIG